MADYTFVFLRHGESIGNVEGYFQGQSDTTLTERGESQIQLLGKRWQGEGKIFDKIISSPLKRAKLTADVIGSALNLVVETDPIWIERDTGKLTQMDREEAKKESFYHEFYTPFNAMGETGEGDWDLFLRAGTALSRLLEQPPGSYLIVSHGGILNQCLRALIGVTPQAMTHGAQFRFDNTGFATVQYDPSLYRWTITGLNDTFHLSEK